MNRMKRWISLRIGADRRMPGLHVTFPAFFSLNASLKGALLFVPGFVLHYSQIMFAFLSLGAANERLWPPVG